MWFGEQAGGERQSTEDGAKTGSWGRGSRIRTREEAALSAP